MPGRPVDRSPGAGFRIHNAAGGALLALTVAFATPAAAQFSVPSGFTDELVIGGMALPVGIAFIPDGRLLVVEQKTADVRLVVNGAFSATDPILHVDDVQTTGNEQGLLGVAVDPGWPARPYIYLHYDYAPVARIRISRFTVGGDLDFTGNGDLQIDPASRHDILTDIPDNANNHNGGTLRFGPDGMLYVSLGDDASGCFAQDLTVLAGKILRLDVDGLPPGGGGPPAKSAITPADNPYVGNANANAKLVGYLGLRNPFRMGIDAVTGDVVIADVGQNVIEEVNWVQTLGKNFEWPHKEGNNNGPQTCAGADLSQFTPPIYTYSHPTGFAVVASVIYRAPPGATAPFPADFEGDIFVSDYYATFLRRLNNNGGSWSSTTWANGASGVSDWLVGPDGSVYYCRQETGVIRRIRNTDTTGVPPGGPPTALEFRAPYPTPASGPVALDFVLRTNGRVRLEVFDLAGRRVRTVVDAEERGAGLNRESWDTRSEAGNAVGAGVYVARLTVGGESIERRLVVAR
jgi:glucose/arabinose dehydrogenase